MGRAAAATTAAPENRVGSGSGTPVRGPEDSRREPTPRSSFDSVADPDPWLTLQQAAGSVQTHEATLRREIRKGRLRAARVGGRRSIRLRRSWLDAWLEDSTTPVEVRR